MALSIQGKDILDALCDLGAPATVDELMQLFSIQYPHMPLTDLRKTVRRALSAGVRFGYLQNEDSFYYTTIGAEEIFLRESTDALNKESMHDQEVPIYKSSSITTVITEADSAAVPSVMENTIEIDSCPADVAVYEDSDSSDDECGDVLDEYVDSGEQDDDEMDDSMESESECDDSDLVDDEDDDDDDDVSLSDDELLDIEMENAYVSDCSDGDENSADTSQSYSPRPSRKRRRSALRDDESVVSKTDSQIDPDASNQTIANEGDDAKPCCSGCKRPKRRQSCSRPRKSRGCKKPRKRSCSRKKSKCKRPRRRSCRPKRRPKKC